MKRIYNTGLDSNQIIFGVTVGTVGIAYTSVYLNRSGGQSVLIKESNVNSGNIPDSNIGDAKSLKSSYLVIRTTIDLQHLDPTLWPGQIDNIIVRYHLDGGFSGNQIYNQDTDDIDVTMSGRIIIITKPIELQ